MRKPSSRGDDLHLGGEEAQGTRECPVAGEGQIVRVAGHDGAVGFGQRGQAAVEAEGGQVAERRRRGRALGQVAIAQARVGEESLREIAVARVGGQHRPGRGGRAQARQRAGHGGRIPHAAEGGGHARGVIEAKNARDRSG